jgi:hypothetical protein
MPGDRNFRRCGHLSAYGFFKIPPVIAGELAGDRNLR